MAKAYAIKQGVVTADVFIETSSRTTIDNIKNSLAILSNNKLSSVLLVSDPWHMKRAMTIAQNFKLDVYSSPTLTSRYKSFYSRIKFTLGEIYYYQRYRLFGI